MTQRDVMVEFKALRLHGMAGAWADLVEQGGDAALDTSRWLIEHLLQAEGTDRAMRSVSHQMHAAKFPVHRDLAGFDNVVLVGGPGTGKTHLATAIGVAGITRHGKRVRFTRRWDLVNALEQEQEKVQGKANPALLRMWEKRQRGYRAMGYRMGVDASNDDVASPDAHGMLAPAAEQADA